MTGTPQTVKQPVDGEVVLTGDAAAIAVPSGQAVTLQDVIWNAAGPNGLTLRFRFLAPQIAREAGDVDFETASADMLALCQTFALPRLAELGPQPQQIIISLADRVVPFGETSPDATQYFEAYSIENGTCIWEMF